MNWQPELDELRRRQALARKGEGDEENALATSEMGFDGLGAMLEVSAGVRSRGAHEEQAGCVAHGGMLGVRWPFVDEPTCRLPDRTA